MNDAVEGIVVSRRNKISSCLLCSVSSYCSILLLQTIVGHCSLKSEEGLVVAVAWPPGSEFLLRWLNFQTKYLVTWVYLFQFTCWWTVRGSGSCYTGVLHRDWADQVRWKVEYRSHKESSYVQGDGTVLLISREREGSARRIHPCIQYSKVFYI